MRTAPIHHFTESHDLRHRLRHRPDGTRVLVKRQSQRWFQGQLDFPARMHAVQSLLDQIASGQHRPAFTYARILYIAAANEWEVTYDPDATVYGINQIFAHVARSAHGVDPSVGPLAILADYVRQHPLAPTMPTSPVLKHVARLQALTTTTWIRYTPRQKAYLAQVHQCPAIHAALDALPYRAAGTALIHGDYRFNNVLFRQAPQIPAVHVIDWEQGGRGPRVYDWGTVMVDYILVYLEQTRTAQGHPTRLPWATIEGLMQQHLQYLMRIYRNTAQTLPQEYYQWLGIQLLLKGLHVVPQDPQGEALAQVLFQMGRRFLVEWEQLHQQFGALYAE